MEEKGMSLEDGAKLSARELGRIQAFHHLEEVIAKYEPMAGTPEEAAYGTVNDKGIMTDKHFDLDKRQIYRLKEMAFHMYESDFANDPLLREIALDVLAHTQREQEESMSLHEISELWKR